MERKCRGVEYRASLVIHGQTMKADPATKGCGSTVERMYIDGPLFRKRGFVTICPHCDKAPK
jgi:hypothetical protein